MTSRGILGAPFRLATLLALALAAPNLTAGPANRARLSVVKVYSTVQREDYAQPWQGGGPGSGTGSGFVIAKRRILTNAHVVSDARFIEVQRDGDPTKYQARVLFAGHDCDLAVLAVDDPAFFQGTRPLALGTRIPALNDEVTVLGYPMGGTRISLTQGVVSRMDYSPYSHSGVDSHLVMQVDAAINPGNSGGPVMFRGRVVGLAFQGIPGAQNIGYAIPLPVLEHFLRDIEDGVYHGYPELGVVDLDTRNPALRRDLRLPGDGGVAVAYVDPFGAAAERLKPRDVLLTVDGHAVANDGTIQLDGNTIEYTELLERKQWGEGVRFLVWRDGSSRVIDVPLRNPPDPFIFRYLYDRRPEYFVTAGLVFVPLSRPFLATLGSDLNTPSAQSLLYHSQYAKVDGLYTNREQFVVLAARLPHPINTYHEPFESLIVHSVNGQAIRRLQDLPEALGHPTNGFHVVTFEGTDDRLVVDARAVPAADREVMARYEVTQPFRFEAEEAP
jgi:S1-C subfamily serine protease